MGHDEKCSPSIYPHTTTPIPQKKNPIHIFLRNTPAATPQHLPLTPLSASQKHPQK